MSVPIVNSAVFLTKFTTTFIQGSGGITFSSVSANPTNSFDSEGFNKRAWRFTLEGVLNPSDTEYILRFDFSNVEVPLSYSFEGDVLGTYTLNRCKPQNARGVFDYTYDSKLKILDLRFFKGKTITKLTNIYFDLSIFDSQCQACYSSNGTYCGCKNNCSNFGSNCKTACGCT